MGENALLNLRMPTVEASGAVFNPWYDLPRIYIASSDPSIISRNNNPPITPICRVELKAHGLTLFFRHDRIIFVGKSEKAYNTINPLLCFFAYRTFINYNIYWSTVEFPDPDQFPELDPIPFTLDRVVRVETEALIEGKPVKTLHHEGRKESREVSVESIATFLKILNQPLYSALLFYLRGCSNPMYFLVEYYKAIETIVDAYGGQKKFFGALRPHGITKTRHSEFGKFSNDKQLAPVDIGRHAPVPGASVHSFDVRTMFYDPRSREIFEKSTSFCRDVIDAYVFELSHQLGSTAKP